MSGLGLLWQMKHFSRPAPVSVAGFAWVQFKLPSSVDRHGFGYSMGIEGG